MPDKNYIERLDMEVTFGDTSLILWAKRDATGELKKAIARIVAEEVAAAVAGKDAEIAALKGRKGKPVDSPPDGIVKVGCAEFRWQGKTDLDLDELVIYDSAGNCVLHLEVMSDQHVWVGVYPTGGGSPEWHINLTSNRKLQMRCEGDE